MNRYLKIFFFLLILCNFFFASWYALHQDITFSADIGRDFLLLQEIDQKKIILIGPRSSVSGLFHGPLWLYVNYPAYAIGHGNPVAVAWWWVILIMVFTFGSYVIAKKLFDETVGYFFALMVSLYMSFHAHSFINPHGVLFTLPFFFFFFIRYHQTKKLRYLLVHTFLGGIMIQFEMAIGIPFVGLSFLAILRQIIISKKFLHIFAFLGTLIPLIPFAIFDLRHQFLLTHGVLRYLSPHSGDPHATYLSLLWDRVKLMTTGVEIIRADPGYQNLGMFAVVVLFLVLQWKQKKYRVIYGSFLYFYVGFFLLSLINKGPILYFYFFPLFPLVFLIFSSFITTKKYSKIFYVIFFILQQ